MKLRHTIFGALAGAALVALSAPQGAVAQIWAQYDLSILPRPYIPRTNQGVQIGTPQYPFLDQYAPSFEDRDNGVAGPIPLGFTFEYDNQPYTDVYVCVNGWLSFQNPGAFLTDDPYSLFNNTRPNLTVAPFFGDHFYRDRTRSTPFFPADDRDPKGRPYTQSAVRFVQIAGDTVNPARFVLEWENLNINYRFDPNRPDDPFAPIDSVQPHASSVGSFQAYLIQAPPGSVSQAGDIEFHYGPVGPPIPFPDTVGSIVKTSGASVGIEDAPSVPGGQTTFMNAVAFRESGGNFDSTTQSRRLTRVWPPTGFPGQAFVFQSTRLRRLTGWGDGDANLTQLDPTVPQFIRDDQRRFVTFLDVIRILRHSATRNVEWDSAPGRHAYHGDVNHNGRYFFSTRTYNDTADSTDGFGNLIRHKVLFPIKSVNEQFPQPADASFSGFLYEANEFDAALIMLYLAAKLPVLPWLPDTLPHFTGKLSPRAQAGDVVFGAGRAVGGNRIEVPVTFNGYLSGALGVGMELAEGARIVEVRTASRTAEAWVEAVAGDDRVALAAAGNFAPTDVVATLVIETGNDRAVGFSNITVGDVEKGARKLNSGSSSTGATMLTISQNSPNPFTALTSTEIAYGVPADGRVTVRVYDLLGREVATLVDASVNRGSYSTQWNGTDAAGNAVSTGVYYCRVESAGQAQTITMQVR